MFLVIFQLGLQGQVEDRTVLLRFVGTMSGDGVIDIMKAKRLKSGDLEPSQINRIRYSNVRSRPYRERPK